MTILINKNIVHVCASFPGCCDRLPPTRFKIARADSQPVLETGSLNCNLPSAPTGLVPSEALDESRPLPRAASGSRRHPMARGCTALGSTSESRLPVPPSYKERVIAFGARLDNPR